MIVYDKLFSLLKSKGLPATNWLRTQGVHAATVDKLRNNKTVTTETLDRLCELLGCDVGDIASHVQVKGED